jgi:hypothetical protein
MIYRSPFGYADKLPVSSVWDFVWSNPNKISDEKDALIDGVTGERWRQVKHLGGSSAQPLFG